MNELIDAYLEIVLDTDINHCNPYAFEEAYSFAEFCISVCREKK